jgi:xanthine dehydrogenase large subunit
VAIIAAVSRESAARGREAVEVEYELLPAILSIDAAKGQKSFIGSARSIQRGDTARALKEAPFMLEGRIVIRGADHFYLESQAAIAYPKENGQIEVHSSSQHPTETQHVVAHGLGLPERDVTFIVKRMGGRIWGQGIASGPHRGLRGARCAETQAPGQARPHQR